MGRRAVFHHEVPVRLHRGLLLSGICLVVSGARILRLSAGLPIPCAMASWCRLRHVLVDILPSGVSPGAHVESEGGEAAKGGRYGCCSPAACSRSAAVGFGVWSGPWPSPSR